MPDRSRDLPIPIGREVTSTSDHAVIDVTVELIPRTAGYDDGVCRREPLDKSLIRLRADRRDSAEAPAQAYLESGTARQLAAALIRAADVVDDLT